MGIHNKTFCYTSRENRKPWLTYTGWPFHHVHRRNVHQQNVHPSHWIYRQSLLFFVDISPIWGLFGIIKQIYHASVGILMECLPEGGWFSRGRSSREDHPPDRRHSIRIPTLAWHICIMSYQTMFVFMKIDHIICRNSYRQNKEKRQWNVESDHILQYKWYVKMFYFRYVIIYWMIDLGKLVKRSIDSAQYFSIRIDSLAYISHFWCTNYSY